MDEDITAGAGALPEPLVSVVADPSEGRHRLPYLLGLLDGDDARTRLTAATAVCLVVDEYPGMCAYVVGRLADRLDGDPPVEVAHALDYLAAKDPKAVENAVADLDSDVERAAREYLFQSGAGFGSATLGATADGPPRTGDGRSATASGESAPRATGVGRTRGPDSGGGPAGDDPQQVYTDPDDRERDRPGGRADGDDGDAGAGPDSGAEGDDSDGVETADSDGRSVTSGTLALVSRRLSAVVDRSRFDDLDVLTDRRRGRYGDVYRAVGAVDGEERPVALRVHRLPADDREAFADGFRAAMERWSAVDDHENVRTVHDWGARPRPWAALERTDATLADVDDLSVEAAVGVALDLSAAVGDTHRRGVVHGAIDPEDVAVSETVLAEDGDHYRPLLANPGLTTAYAGYFDASESLDPRYAAPEHYTDRFGAVDNATDVYGLGALVHRLTTGRPPYDGPFEEVRTGVVAGDPPTPTAVDPALPDGIDRVVRKAMAARKLTRYETVTAFRRELRAVAATAGDDGDGTPNRREGETANGREGGTDGE